MIKRTCRTCKKDFLVTTYDERKGKRIYCSAYCSNSRGIKKFRRYCKTCKKVFIATKAMDSGGKHIRKYCSRKCMGIGWTRGHNPHIYKGEKIERICKICKEVFEMKKSDYERNKNKGAGSFCSRGCRNKFYVMTSETREKMSKRQLKQWQNKEFREKQLACILKGLFKRPTSLEQQMIDIIKRNNLPYKYTGNGSFLIGYKNPDFINHRW